MGVPSFYRWLVKKYPKIVTDAIEDRTGDLSFKNPNGLEFDNFYLDMNGIIHPCFHPDDQDDVSAPTTFEHVFTSIYDYIDRLFSIVRPRQLLYMAIDGVAPRAKMNQQRARRFRTSKDNQMAEEMEEKLRKQFEKEGKTLLPKEESQVSDSNIITPGTEFMFILSQKLETYIRLRMSENPAWSNIKVILSDSNVPGEGEHKIMSFIRSQRSLPEYDPNTRHCLYGLDADLIMLALATHEIHFSILREDVLISTNQLNDASLTLNNTLLKAEKCSLEAKSTARLANKKQSYQFLNVWVLREYLAFDVEITSPQKSDYDFERVIDDFVFICFFAGNDFLPHMPTLEIREDCVDLLMHVYKKEFGNLGGYLVDTQKVYDKKGAYVKLKRVERFMLDVGQYEDRIFQKRTQLRDKTLRRILSEYKDSKDYEDVNDDERSSDIVNSYSEVGGVDHDLNNTKELKQKVKDYIQKQSDLFKDGGLGTDKVKFGAAGWRERFYQEKFNAQPDEIEIIRKSVVSKYGEGLQWVLLYYFSGVPSWTWFYPYHYGLPASELKGLSQTNVKFQEGLPFTPFDQLMGVLPPRSAHALPSAFKDLMIDEKSNIIDFYPNEFETDMDGKRFSWQGVCKLPFIDEERLLTETKKLEITLKDNEIKRNSQTLEKLFIRFSSKCALENVLCCAKRVASEKIKGAVKMDSNIEGIKGFIHLMPEDLIESNDRECTKNDLVRCLFYEVKQAVQNGPRLLEGVNIPEKIVDKDDISETILWHERTQNPRPKKPDHTLQFRPQDGSPGITSKGAGVGFLGRGHSQSPTTTYPNHAVDYTPRNERSKPGSSRREDFRGIGDLRISESRPSSNYRASSNYGPRPGGNTFWNSQNARDQDWRYNLHRRQPMDEPFSGQMGRGRGRGRGM